jgi:hypothetical protein
MELEAVFEERKVRQVDLAEWAGQANVSTGTGDQPRPMAGLILFTKMFFI